MNYSELLTDEEIETIVHTIAPRVIKDHFKIRPQDFHKIAPGRVAKKLSDKEATNYVLKNQSTPFIATLISTHIDSTLEIVTKERQDQIKNGVSEETALALALNNSAFYNCIELYFKLTGDDVSDDYISNIEKLMKQITISEEVSPITDPNLTLAEDQSNQIAELQRQLKEAKDALAICEQEKTKAKEELSAAHVSIENYRQEQLANAAELADFRKRAVYEKREVSFCPVLEYDHTSICAVISKDINGNIKVSRIADIDSKGIVDRFSPAFGREKTFDNSDTIFVIEGPTNRGVYGVWDWAAIPNDRNPDKAYYKSTYNDTASPVQVVVVPDCKNIDQLVEKLSAGIEVVPAFDRVLFAFYTGKEVLTGLLCDEITYSITGSKLSLNSDVSVLPQYSFESRDILKLENKLGIFKRLRLGMPEHEIRVRDVQSIVKEIVLKRVSWPVFKAKGITKNDWQSFKKYLEQIPEEGIVEEIMTACRCSESEATQFLAEFHASANKYLDGNTIEEAMIAAAIMGSPELLQRSKKMVEDEWRSENETAIKDASAELADTKAEFSDTMRQLTDAKSELEKIKQQTAETSSVLDEKLNLAAGVESIVEERIQRAKENAAEFIASMAFASPAVTITSSPYESENTSSIKIPFCEVRNSDNSNAEEYNDVNALIDIISEELPSAGVMSKYSRPLAAYLYACYCTHTPVILVGPNAQDIADAFSYAISGNAAGRLSCDGDYTADIRSVCEASESKIISVSNPFNSNWVTRLPEIIQTESKFFIAVYPFSEDVLIEPKSTFNYFIPIFTEFFVNDIADRAFNGGKPAASFKPYQPRVQESKYDKTVSSLRASLILRRKLQLVLTNMENLLGAASPDAAFLFALLPYAYATMQVSSLSEIIRNGNTIQLSSEMKRHAKELFGEFE